MASSIEWLSGGETWNPVRGCAPCSPGCANCYATRSAIRQAKPGQAYHGLVKSVPAGKRRLPKWTGSAREVPEKLAEPLSWRARARKMRCVQEGWRAYSKHRTLDDACPYESGTSDRERYETGWHMRRLDHTPEPGLMGRLRVFVNSMSDLFHEDVTFEFIAAVYGVMAACPDIDFLVLTKRPARMVEWYGWLYTHGISNPDIYRPDLQVCEFYAEAHTYGELTWTPRDEPWPLPNVHVGVSVEDQQRADERIPLLLKVPATVRWVSAEPLLGPVDVSRWVGGPPIVTDPDLDAPDGASVDGLERVGARWKRVAGLDWLVCGGESGPGARPYDLSWPRSLIEQCQAAGVPVFHKQLGSGHRWAASLPGERKRWQPEGGKDGIVYRHPKGADMAEWPADLRVREYPEAR